MSAGAWDERPVVLTVAPCGAEVMRDLQPAVPYTPSEIAGEVEAAVDAGATVAHLHVREPDGRPTHRVEVFEETISEIRRRCDVVCNVSTGGAVWMTFDERVECLGADADMAGVETGSLNFAGEPFVTSGPQTARVIELAAARGWPLEAECFDLGHVAEAARLCGEHPRIRLLNLVLGVPGGAPATPDALRAMVSHVPPGTAWGATAVGRHQRRMLGLALTLGATGIRVGFEDNVYVERGRLARSNAELVSAAVSLVHAVGRRVATPAEARDLLSVPPERSRA